MEQNDVLRKSWKKGSKLEIYSESKQQWFKGQIVRIFTDAEGEWLSIKYAGFNIKEVQRFTKFIRPIRRQKAKPHKKDIASNHGTPSAVHKDDDDSKCIERANEERKKSSKAMTDCNEQSKSTKSVMTDLNLNLDSNPMSTLMPTPNFKVSKFESLELRQLRLIDSLSVMQNQMQTMAQSMDIPLDSIRNINGMISESVNAENVQCVIGVMDTINDSISRLFEIAVDIQVTAERNKVVLPDQEVVSSLISALSENEKESENVINRVDEEREEKESGDLNIEEQRQKVQEMKVEKVHSMQSRNGQRIKRKVDPLLCRMDNALKMVNDAIEEHKLAVEELLETDLVSMNALLMEVKEQLTAS